MIYETKCSDVHPGTMLIADGGFTCIKEGDVLTVEADRNGMYVPCRDGKHYLDGQVDRGHYVGLRKLS